MRILKSIAVAFSMYSRIPMPKFNWDSEDMKYHLIFFPWIGAVIGALEYGLLQLSLAYGIDKPPFVILMMVIPIIITGGFHVDGFMDTSDALASWEDKEKKLEILKDSHVGAFAIIRLITLGMVYFVALYCMDNTGYMALAFSFFAARAISGICVINFKKAKNDGILNTSAKTASEKVVVVLLAIQFLICAILAGNLYVWYWTVALVGLLVALIYYRFTAYTKFGGITGDLAGWFVCNAEVFMAIAIAIYSIFK